MNDDPRYHVPIENRSYRIQRSTGVNAYLQRCWPHHQHRFLAYMYYKTFEINTDIVTQKELIDEFGLNKGVVSATIKKILRRKHIEQISKVRPYRYQLTMGGEQFARYILTHFPKYHLDIFHYFDTIELQEDDIRCIKQSQVLLKNVEDIYGPTKFSTAIYNRLWELLNEISMELTRLFDKFNKLSLGERKEILKKQNCKDLTTLYRLLEDEFQIRYFLTNMIKMDEYIRKMKENVNLIEIATKYENYMVGFLMEEYSEPFLDDIPVKPFEGVLVPAEESNVVWDWGVGFLEDLKSIKEVFSSHQDSTEISELEDSKEMEQK